MFTRMAEERTAKLEQLQSDNLDLQVLWDMEKDEFVFRMIDRSGIKAVYGECSLPAATEFNQTAIDHAREFCRKGIELFKNSKEYLQ